MPQVTATYNLTYSTVITIGIQYQGELNIQYNADKVQKYHCTVHHATIYIVAAQCI